MSHHVIPEREIFERPEGYEGPNLSPVGLQLTPRLLGTEAAYALLANIPPKDNNGVVVGDDAALIIDAGITPEISAQIQSLASELTDRPLRYVVNTTYHGDHTFGNLAFADEVVIISSRINKENMTDLNYEKRVRTGNMYGDEKVLESVTHWRRPDLVFDGFAEIDLGNRLVQLWHFGPGNGPGDTIVYVPATRTAWTGNYLCHAGTAHMLLQGGPLPYLDSLRRMKETLPDLQTIVPGHGPIGEAQPAIDTLMDYLQTLHDEVVAAVAAGRSLDETEASATNPWINDLHPELAEAMSSYAVPADIARQQMLDLCRNLHRLNVMATYRLYSPTAGGPLPGGHRPAFR